MPQIDPIPHDLRSSRRLGIALVLLSAIGWSLAGVFTKGVSADAWSVVFWRSVFAAPLVTAYLAWKNGAVAVTSVTRLGSVGWFTATVSSLATIAFITSFKHTYIANVALIYGAVPFAAAAIAWLFLGERSSRTVLLLSAVAFVGVVVMIGGGVGLGNLYGDGLALCMMVGMAVYLVMVRQFPKAPMIAAQTMSSLQMLVVAWFLSAPLSATWSDIGWIALFGVVHAVAVVMLTEGTRLIPAAEAGFLGGLEVPLAPLFAWLILSEFPPIATFAGGAIILAAVAGHLVLESRK